MARYKITFGFRLAAVGGSESYISPDVTPSQATAVTQQLIDLRMKMLHSTVAIDKMRFAKLDPLQKRRSVAYPPGTFNVFVRPDENGVGGVPLVIPTRGTGDQNNFTPDHVKSVLLVRVTFDTDRNAPHYLFGTPDAVLESDPGGFAPARVASWQTALKNFRSNLIGKAWCIRARRRDTGYVPVDIQTWVRADETLGNLGVVINSASTPAIVQSDVIQILNTRRLGSDRTSYNGKYVVSSVVAGPATNQFTIFLRGTGAGLPESIKRLGQIQRIGHDFFPIQEFEGIQPTTRKRGRPFGQPRGNRRKVPSLDF